MSEPENTVLTATKTEPSEPRVHEELLRGEPWKFDPAVVEIFDEMLDRSVPGYAEMRDLVTRVVNRRWIPKTWIVDLGCARGGAIAPLIDTIGARGRFLACDASEPMIEAFRERFRGWIDCGIVEARVLDLRQGIPAMPASVTLLILTLQFVPMEYRLRLLRSVHRNLTAGGTLVLVEKVIGETAEIDDVLVNEHLDHKRRVGYTDDEILRKKLALEGVMVPVSATWNVDSLKRAGFDGVDCFWRNLNFAGWIATKA